MNWYYGERGIVLIRHFLTYLKEEHGVEGVYLAAFNCTSVIHCALDIGFQWVEFLDLEAENFLVDLRDVRPKGGKSCLLYTHVLGHEHTPRSTVAQMKAEGVIDFAIDDRCLCNPEHDDPTCTLFDAVFYSFGSSKQIPIGQGGAAKVRAEHAHAFDGRFGPFDLATTLASDIDLPLQSAVRRQHREAFTQALGPWALPPAYNQWRFNLLCSHPEVVESEAFNRGAFCSRHYRNEWTANLPVSHAFSSRIVNLFIGGEYSEAQMQDLIAATRFGASLA